MRRLPLLLLLLLVLCLAACGSTKHAAPPTTTTTAPAIDAAAILGPGARIIYQGTGWGVVAAGQKAVAVRLVGTLWRADRTGRVKITILGPTRPTSKVTQVAAGLKAPSTIVEDALWVDGKELLEKGGGTPSSLTIYGSTGPLKPGTHMAVAYGRTATSGTAVAWTFTVR